MTGSGGPVEPPRTAARASTPPRPKPIKDDAAGAALFERHDVLVFDLDGVLYRGDQPIPAAASVLQALRTRHVPVVFLTNNSARTQAEVADRLTAMGLGARPEEVLTSAIVTAAMLQREAGPGSTAFVVGERGVRDAVAAVGVHVLDGEPERADFVVVGWDRSTDYARLRTACLLVERGARLVATNADGAFPAADGLWPGAGALLAVITITTGATPVVGGKPARPMFDEAARMSGGVSPLMVGDRLDTDIAGAAGAGWDSMLVLTGASVPADLPAAVALPTYLAQDVGAILAARAPARVRLTSPGDAGGIARLLAASGLRDDGVSERLARTVVIDAAGDGDVPAATAALVRAGDSEYLCSVAVRPDVRGQGLGLLVSAGALRLAGMPDDSGATAPVYLATETAAPLFQRLGFDIVAGQPPGEVRALMREHGCEASATVLRRSSPSA